MRIKDFSAIPIAVLLNTSDVLHCNALHLPPSVIIPLQPFTLPLDKNVDGANDVITTAKNMRFVLVDVSQRVLEKKATSSITLSCTPSLYSLVVLLWCSAFR